MNPRLKESRLERERRLDPQRSAMEYLAEFAEDLDSFLPSLWIDQAVIVGRQGTETGWRGKMKITGTDTELTATQVNVASRRNSTAASRKRKSSSLRAQWACVAAVLQIDLAKHRGQ